MDYDFSLFLIGVRSWNQMTIYKEYEYNRQIKVGKILEGYKGNLFHKFYDNSKSLAENVEHRCLEGIEKDDWQAFLEYHLEEDMLLYTHVGGSKSLARRTEKEEIRHGRHFSRGEMWTMVHRRKDGSYIHDDARALSSYGGQIEEYQKEIVELKAAEEKKKRQTMENLLRFLTQQRGDDLSYEITSEMNILGSGPAASHPRPSSDNLDTF
ncbi:hypothetical protein PIB30_052818 [Stylosanthes scabra]|uniref:Uncharacterized protein n=1 Tax=Stylosanthes scabra TaxID=79078 RepID=A0ABU6YHK3_9FABA|nr:hypothetical protein [Stylosanthes scabra]